MLVADSGSGPVVVTTDDGGAAARAGLAPGDVIVSIDGERVLSAEQLAARVRAGTGPFIRMEARPPSGTAAGAFWLPRQGK